MAKRRDLEAKAQAPAEVLRKFHSYDVLNESPQNTQRVMRRLLLALASATEADAPELAASVRVVLGTLDE